MRIAVLGRTHWLLAAARRAIEAGHEVVFVATSPAAAEYRASERDFEALASRVGSRFVCTGRWTDAETDALRASGAEIGLSVNWPMLLPPAALEACRWGIANAHAGDLPRFRGNACPNWAILAGETRIVLTVHRMVPELDAGPIYGQRAMALTTNTRIGDVYTFLEDAIPGLFLEVLALIAAGRLSPRPQPADPGLALRCYPRRPGDAELQWTAPAASLARLVRASSEPFAGAFTWLDGVRLTVWRAHEERLPSPVMGVPGQVIERRIPDGSVAVLAGEGCLVLEEVQLAGDVRRAPCELLRSSRARLGLDLPAEIEQLRRRIADLETRLGG